MSTLGTSWSLPFIINWAVNTGSACYANVFSVDVHLIYLFFFFWWAAATPATFLACLSDIK